MILFRWLITAIAIGIAAYLIPGVDVTPLGAVVLAVVLALINIFLKPIISLLTLPLTIITLGLFSLVVNALLIMLADVIVPDFTVNGFWPAFFFAILVSLLNAILGGLGKR
jgi:putative membrane protein